MTLRWRKEPRETGLAAVGTGPYRSSSLWLDNENDYLATVSADGGDWRKPFRGWYWVARTNQEKGIKLFNSYPRVYETEKEAKDAARKYVLECMAAHNANKGT